MTALTPSPPRDDALNTLRVVSIKIYFHLAIGRALGNFEGYMAAVFSSISRTCNENVICLHEKPNT